MWLRFEPGLRLVVKARVKARVKDRVKVCG